MGKLLPKCSVVSWIADVCCWLKADLPRPEIEVRFAPNNGHWNQGDVDEADSSDLDCVGEAIAAAARRGLELT